MFGRNAFWMELYTVDREGTMAKSHDMRTILTRCFACCVDFEASGDVGDDQRMVTGRRIRGRDIRENAGPIMRDRARFAMHQTASLYSSTEILPDSLMAQAHAKQRRSSSGARGHQGDTDTGVVGCAWSGRNEKAMRAAAHCRFHIDRVVANDFHLSVEFQQVVDQIESETVVIIDNEDHAAALFPLFDDDDRTDGCTDIEPIARRVPESRYVAVEKECIRCFQFVAIITGQNPKG